MHPLFIESVIILEDMQETDCSFTISDSGKQKFIVNHVYAFVNEKGEHGNPAGVVILNENSDFPLEDQTMINVAKQVGYPETAFVQIRNRANSSFDVDVRFATPVSANGFCGHATVATFGFLLNNQLISSTSVVKMRTIVLGEDGIDSVLTTIPIKCYVNFIEMEQKLPTFHEVDDTIKMKEYIASSLQLPITCFYETMEIVNTGGIDAIIGQKEKSVLDNVKLTKEVCDMISEVSKTFKVVGYHLFPLDALVYDATPNIGNMYKICVKGVRNFAPVEGIPEEPATGSACGAMACFIIKNIFIPTFKTNNSTIDCSHVSVQVTFEQGRIFGCPSIIISNVDYDIKTNAFVSVKVSGRFHEKPYKRSIVFV